MYWRVYVCMYRWKYICINHRVGRAKLFLQRRRNWDSPTPFGRGGGTLACGRRVGGVPIPTRGHTHCTHRGALHIYISTLWSEPMKVRTKCILRAKKCVLIYAVTVSAYKYILVLAYLPSRGWVFLHKACTRIVSWHRDWRKKFILFMIGADNRHFVFLANAEQWAYA